MGDRWLLPGILSIFLLAAPAKAGQLQFWRFDSSQNRLEFITDEGVQPQAQVISDPVRLVIDLPGTVLRRPSLTQPVGGAIRTIRVGQFDRQTTRLVIEFVPGYTIDPQQVRFRGVTANRWSVQTGIADCEVRKARFYVLRNTPMPSILIEVGFLTGQNDAPKLADPSYRSQTAVAIAHGIMQYLQIGNPQAIAP